MNPPVLIFLTELRSYVMTITDDACFPTETKFERLTEAIAYAMRLGMDCRFELEDGTPIGCWNKNDGLRLYANLNAQGEHAHDFE